MSLIKKISFSSLGDERGSLIALESRKCIPFDIKRIYSIYDTHKGVSRGYHAHIKLKQVAVCITGSCRFVFDNGFQKEEVILNSALEGVLIEGLIWREIYDISPDCVLIVLANEYYDENDYIRDYDDFLKIVHKKSKF